MVAITARIPVACFEGRASADVTVIGTIDALPSTEPIVAASSLLVGVVRFEPPTQSGVVGCQAAKVASG